MEILDKLKKWISRTVGPSLLASLEPLAHQRNVASLSLFYSHLNWLYWFHLIILEEGLLVILIDGTIFLSPFPDVIRIARLWNSLPIEYFPLTYS